MPSEHVLGQIKVIRGRKVILDTDLVANVLNSPLAISMSIEIVRTFIELRRALISHHELKQKIDDLARIKE